MPQQPESLESRVHFLERIWVFVIAFQTKKLVVAMGLGWLCCYPGEHPRLAAAYST
jgi:hypothetical protein